MVRDLVRQRDTPAGEGGRGSPTWAGNAWLYAARPGTGCPPPAHQMQMFQAMAGQLATPVCSPIASNPPLLRLVCRPRRLTCATTR